uniref:Uncharacterized protein n=1 Tax=Anopheles farauti TaxID=69004 RepID=A0A182Q3C3_9DIPT
MEVHTFRRNFLRHQPQRVCSPHRARKQALWLKPFGRRCTLLHELHDFGSGNRSTGLAQLPHDERERKFAGRLVRHADDGRILDGRVRQQHGLDLGRRHLVALVLDQLLQPVDDVKLTVRVVVPNVAGVQPAVRVDRVACGRRVTDVTAHDLRPAEAQLAALVRPERPTRRRIDHLHLRADLHPAYAARLVAVTVLEEGRERQLTHAVTLADVAHLRQPAPQQLLRLPCERSRTADDRVDAAEIVAVDERVLREKQHDRRHRQERVATVRLDAAEIEEVLELRQRYHALLDAKHVQEAQATERVKPGQHTQQHQRAFQFRQRRRLAAGRARSSRDTYSVRAALAITFACVSCTPFGSPVVPDEHMISATCSCTFVGWMASVSGFTNETGARNCSSSVGPPSNGFSSPNSTNRSMKRHWPAAATTRSAAKPEKNTTRGLDRLNACTNSPGSKEEEAKILRFGGSEVDRCDGGPEQERSDQHHRKLEPILRHEPDDIAAPDASLLAETLGKTGALLQELHPHVGGDAAHGAKLLRVRDDRGPVRVAVVERTLGGLRLQVLDLLPERLLLQLLVLLRLQELVVVGPTGRAAVAEQLRDQRLVLQRVLRVEEALDLALGGDAGT